MRPGGNILVVLVMSLVAFASCAQEDYPVSLWTAQHPQAKTTSAAARVDAGDAGTWGRPRPGRSAARRRAPKGSRSGSSPSRRTPRRRARTSSSRPTSSSCSTRCAACATAFQQCAASSETRVVAEQGGPARVELLERPGRGRGVLRQVAIRRNALAATLPRPTSSSHVQRKRCAARATRRPAGPPGQGQFQIAVETKLRVS